MRAEVLEWIKGESGMTGNRLIRKYVTELLAEIQQREASKDCWMREDLLISECYFLQMEGRQVSLKEMLFGEESLNIKQNIIIVSGKKHIGKRSFVKKLVEACAETLKENRRMLKWSANKGIYRIPIIINHEWYVGQGERELSLEDLIVAVIEDKLNCNFGEQEKIALKKDVENLLTNGRFFIYFEGEWWFGKSEYKLQEILRYGRIVEKYKKGAVRRNLVFLTVNDETDIKNSLLNKSSYILFTLKELSKEEVFTYLKNSDFNSKEILLKLCEDNPEILEMLQYPDHLRMVGELDGLNLIKEEHEEKLKNKFIFYDFFIRAKIEKKLIEKECKRKKSTENLVYNALQKYALEFYMGKGSKQIKETRSFSKLDYIDCGLLDKDMQFCFTICGNYLAAKELLLKVQKKELYAIDDVFLEKPLENILIMVSEMIKDIAIFEDFWRILYKNNSCKLLLLARIVKNSSFEKSYVAEIYEKAFYNLQKDFYDYTVLEMFQELENDGVTYLKKEYLSLEEKGKYTQTQINNIKKRSIYFLGISHNGIIERMLEELMEEKTDEHLKYHIIRAAVENYKKDKESTRIIDEKMDELADYCVKSKDPIIKSDFAVLYKKSQEREWTTGEREREISQKVKELMDSDIYWKRAHAAGAIGRRNVTNAISLLLERIEKELEFIYKKKAGYRNSIKVISYSVEAMCEMIDRKEGDSEKVINALLQCLDLDKLGDQDIEDAYATIATGIEYIINGDSSKLPFNLGGRFRNHAISYQRVLLNTFRQLLDDDFNENETIAKMAEEKISQMEEIVHKPERKNLAGRNNDKEENKIRILQLTDFHIVKERSSNDNQLINAIKDYIKNIDILLITGDLKQYWGDYKETEKILEELIKELNLSKEDVFMVPGNHDSNDYNEKSKVIKEIRENIYNDKECYRDYISTLYKGFRDYEKFLDEFYGPDLKKNGDIHNKLLSWKDKINILCMNTALFCDADSEAHKMVDIIELTGLNRDNTLPTICISHHKLSQLQEDHKNDVKGIFEHLRVGAMLSGDIHKSSIEFIKLSGRKVPNFICGKFLGESLDQWSSREIAVYEVDLSTRLMTPYLYELKDANLIPAFGFKRREDNNIDKWKEETVYL